MRQAPCLHNEDEARILSNAGRYILIQGDFEKIQNVSLLV